jgi:predicted dehydrogenase
MARPVEALLVGGGDWGKTLLDASTRTESLRIRAAVDPRLPSLAVPTFGSLSEALHAHPAQAIVAATPNTLHLANVKEAASYGLHVFVEKPIARTSAQGREMISLCEEAGVCLMVGHNTRRMAGHRWLKTKVDSGAFGRIVSAEASFSHAGLVGLKSEAWRSDPEACPAVGLTQLGVHFADTLCWLLGEVVEVKSLFGSIVGEGGVQDSTHALLRFASGPIATLSSNYSTPYIFRIGIHGTEARAQVDFGRFVVWHPLSGKEESWELPEEDTLAQELEEFAQCIRGERSPETGGREGLTAWEVIEAALTQSPRPGVKLGEQGPKDPLASFLDQSGRLIAWPSPKKRPLQLVALHRLAGRFEPGRSYTETEVNAILKTWHTFGDWALLRREMVDEGLLARTDDVRTYWRTDKPSEPSP